MKKMRDEENKKIIASFMEKVKDVSDVINCNEIITKYLNSYSPAKNIKQKTKNEKNRKELEIILDEFIQKEPLNNYVFKEKNEYYKSNLNIMEDSKEFKKFNEGNCIIIQKKNKLNN